jgi:hypothetical protein
MLRAEKYGWHGVVSPHQKLSVRGVLEEAEGRRSQWSQGFRRLAALALEGQKLMDAGELPSLVLPWIEKFFISSRRQGDVDYLPSIVRWLEERGLDPLILFWEDSARPRAPSFQLALEELRRRGHPYQGIGVFADGGTRRRNAEAVILQEHRDARLFALRPFADRNNPRPLQRLLEDLDEDFFRTYDSSWKDNLCFLYEGTQVCPLLSIQCETETFSPWVVADGRKHPFGAFWRRRLRRAVLGEKPSGGEPDDLSSRYALWASLG